MRNPSFSLRPDPPDHHDGRYSVDGKFESALADAGVARHVRRSIKAHTADPSPSKDQPGRPVSPLDPFVEQPCGCPERLTDDCVNIIGRPTTLALYGSSSAIIPVPHS